MTTRKHLRFVIGATSLIAIWMLAGGALHMLKPEVFFRVVPDGLPKLTVVYVSGVVEMVIGAAVLFPRSRAGAGLAFAALCLGFLPLHVWDFLRTDPVFEPPVWASVRCGVQILAMLIGWRLWQVSQSRSESYRRRSSSSSGSSRRKSRGLTETPSSTSIS